MISTSPIKISCVVRADQLPDAVRALHEAFELGEEDVKAEHPFGGARQHEGRRRGRHRRRRHRHARASCASATSRPTRSSRSPPSAPPAASSTGFGTIQPLDRRDDPGLRHRDLLRGRDHVARVGAALRRRPARSWSTTRARSASRTASRSSSPRSTRRRWTATSGIIANPNCSTMELMLPAKAIHDAAGIERLIVSTYQCVSGTGVKAVEELEAQTRAAARRRAAARAAGLSAPDRVQRPRRRRQLRRGRRLHRRGAQDDVRDAQDPRRPGHRHLRHLRARARSPYSHSLSRQPPDARRPARSRTRARRSRAFPGCVVVDDPADPRLPDGARRRRPRRGLRRPPAPRPVAPAAINLWVVSDNLYKGAATNAVQLAEVLHERGLVGTASA